jgi:hypothetical protein
MSDEQPIGELDRQPAVNHIDQHPLDPRIREHPSDKLFGALIACGGSDHPFEIPTG